MVIKQKILNVLWVLAVISIMVLFVAAMYKRNADTCTGYNVDIINKHQGTFVTDKEVAEIVNNNGEVSMQSIKQINSSIIEKLINLNPWVKNAEVYFDNNNALQINIEQRKPIAKIFSVFNKSFYIDENAFRMPSKVGASARVLVITGFASDNDILANTDSVTLMNACAIANYIYKDSFLQAQIAQVHINTNGNFELISNVGNHTILFGNANNIEEKFDRLITFYNNAWLQNGINTYEKLDVRFSNQVVATKRGASVKQQLVRDSLNAIVDTSGTIILDDYHP